MLYLIWYYYFAVPRCRWMRRIAGGSYGTDFTGDSEAF